MIQRIVTGILAGTLFLILLWTGGSWFSSFTILLSVLALFEFLRMLKVSLISLVGITSFIFLALLLLALYEPFAFMGVYLEIHLLLLSFMFILLFYTVMTKNMVTLEQCGAIVVGLVYITFGFYYLAHTRIELENGLVTVVFILLAIWVTDSSAYFTGRKWGKRKLWPSISPNKTIEGFLGGILFAMLSGLILQGFLQVWSSWEKAITLSIIVSLLGQMGDLVESAMKRHYGIKDSGSILPGHGGILDRFDSLLYVFPILYVLQLL